MHDDPIGVGLRMRGVMVEDACKYAAAARSTVAMGSVNMSGSGPISEIPQGA